LISLLQAKLNNLRSNFWLLAMEYPHWLMVAGALLVALGIIAFAFSDDPA
jgi:hypothetical protein